MYRKVGFSIHIRIFPKKEKAIIARLDMVFMHV
jgi:hypothetical protein